MRPLALVVLALSPSLALAQLDIKLRQQQESVVLGAGSCEETVAVSFTIFNMCEEVQFWLSETSCQNELPSGTSTIAEFQPSEVFGNQGVFEIDVDLDLPLFAGDAGVACGTAGHDRKWNVCGSYAPFDFTGLACATTRTKDSSPPTIRYDSLPPAAPTINSVEGLDGALAINVSGDADADTFIIRVEAPDGNVITKDFPGGGTIRVDGLQNNTVYSVTAVAIDLAGNESPPSAAMEGTPRATAGFYRHYRDAGGSETGGCSHAGAVLAAWAALAALVAVARRRRSR